MNELPNLQPLTVDCGEVDIPHAGPLNNAKQNSSLEILIRYVLWDDRVEGGGG